MLCKIQHGNLDRAMATLLSADRSVGDPAESGADQTASAELIEVKAIVLSKPVSQALLYRTWFRVQTQRRDVIGR